MNIRKPKKAFREAVRAEGVTITAELTLQRETGPADVLAQARLLEPWVDAIQVNDNPLAGTQMSSLAASVLLLDAGIDPIPIVTCRDRNRIALTGDLLGMRALGISSVLLMRGHRVPKKHPFQAATVFDLSGRELIALAAGLQEEDEGRAGGKLFIGVGARAFLPNAGWQAESLKARSQAGAEFLQTQLCFNPRLLRQYMQRLVDQKVTWDYSVMVSLSPLPSAETARWVKSHLSDSKIPAAVIQRLEQAADPEREGIEICAELMREMATIPGIAGINLVTTGNPQAMVEAIRVSGLRPS